MVSQKDHAASPVIGAILMVVITVMLAAIIAAFVFGAQNAAFVFGDQNSFETKWTHITVIDKCTGLDGLYRLVYNDNETAVVDAPVWNKAIIGEKYYADIGYGYSGLTDKIVFAIFTLLTEEEYNSTCEGKGYKC